jgi:hypothetical protein
MVEQPRVLEKEPLARAKIQIQRRPRREEVVICGLRWGRAGFSRGQSSALSTKPVKKVNGLNRRG